MRQKCRCVWSERMTSLQIKSFWVWQSEQKKQNSGLTKEKNSLALKNHRFLSTTKQVQRGFIVSNSAFHDFVERSFLFEARLLALNPTHPPVIVSFGHSEIQMAIGRLIPQSTKTGHQFLFVQIAGHLVNADHLQRETEDGQRESTRAGVSGNQLKIRTHRL